MLDASPEIIEGLGAGTNLVRGGRTRLVGRPPRTDEGSALNTGPRAPGGRLERAPGIWDAGRAAILETSPGMTEGLGASAKLVTGGRARLIGRLARTDDGSALKTGPRAPDGRPERALGT